MAPRAPTRAKDKQLFSVGRAQQMTQTRSRAKDSESEKTENCRVGILQMWSKLAVISTALVACPAATAETATSWLDAVRPGQSSTDLGQGCTGFDWEETQSLQADFFARQHVDDCSSPDVRFLVLRSWKVGGLASVMQEVTTALHVAYTTGRVLLFAGDGEYHCVDILLMCNTSNA